MKIWLRNLLTENKLGVWHGDQILKAFERELKSHDWFHAFADDHRSWKNGNAHMEEIRDAIGWMHTNFPRVDQSSIKLVWNENAPAQFKKNFPKNLKKYNKVPAWITKILKTKEPEGGVRGVNQRAGRHG